MNRATRILLVCLFALATLAGCGSDQTAGPTPTFAPVTAGTPVPPADQPTSYPLPEAPTQAAYPTP
jgi:hypothetical protein